MAHRSTTQKKLRRLRKLMRSTPPAFIDPVQYLRDRRYADTAGAARQMILDGKLKVGSHAVGIGDGFEFNDLGQPVATKIVVPIKSEFRDQLIVLTA